MYGLLLSSVTGLGLPEYELNISIPVLFSPPQTPHITLLNASLT